MAEAAPLRPGLRERSESRHFGLLLLATEIPVGIMGWGEIVGNALLATAAASRRLRWNEVRRNLVEEGETCMWEKP